MAEATLTPGGLALDTAGNPADLPRDLAHKVNGGLLDVVALLDAAMDLCPIDGANRDDDNVHDDSSRLVSLINMANKKVRKIIRKDLSPHV